MRRPLVLVLLAGLLPAAGQAADPSALWKIVNGQCVPHQQASGNPAPCAEVNLTQGVERGWALLKDIRGIAQYLLIPTARVSGIDDPAILAPGAPNYWVPAWQARTLVERKLGKTLPRDGFALSINSAYGRSQDQLHIHIDCIRLDVRQALLERLAEVGAKWAPFPVPLAGSAYRAMRTDGDTLTVDPFRLLADGDPEAAAAMGRHTLALVGVTFAGDAKGFVLLDGQATVMPPDRGHSEALEDHDCAIADR